MALTLPDNLPPLATYFVPLASSPTRKRDGLLARVPVATFHPSVYVLASEANLREAIADTVDGCRGERHVYERGLGRTRTPLLLEVGCPTQPPPPLLVLFLAEDISANAAPAYQSVLLEEMNNVAAHYYHGAGRTPGGYGVPRVLPSIRYYPSSDGDNVPMLHVYHGGDRVADIDVSSGGGAGGENEAVTLLVKVEAALRSMGENKMVMT